MSNLDLMQWKQIPMDMRPKLRFWLPAAAVDHNDLIEEIESLYGRGFGGIEVVSLFLSKAEHLFSIAYGPEGWGTKRWNEVVRTINDNALRLGMSMDLLNGPGWPISAPCICSADDPAILCEMTFGVTEVIGGGNFSGEIPTKKSLQHEGTSRLIHCAAYRSTEKAILEIESYIDLTAYINLIDNVHSLNYKFPNEEGSNWIIFAFYEQPAIQKTNVGQNYVIDHLSVTGAEASKKYWNEFFTNTQYEAMESIFCDSLEYKVTMDWTPNFLSIFIEQRGYDLRPYLPFIGFINLFPNGMITGFKPNQSYLTEMVNNDYAEVITQLFCNNHLTILEETANEFGKTLRYQVAYNRPIEIERSALFVSIPENEALGRVTIDGMKTMAAAVHLGQKSKYSFECAAEFGNTYGQDFEDLLWWIKRSYMAGMNAQVLHGGSYSGGYHGKYSVNGNLPGIEWPGFDGFLKSVSNNWNRTLSEMDSKAVMDTIARMNIIFRKKSKIDCIIYRDSYTNDGEGSEFFLYNDNGMLAKQGYTYEYASEYLLTSKLCNVKDGMIGNPYPGYKCLIIPEITKVSVPLMSRIKEFVKAGFPVIWVGSKPLHSRYLREWISETDRQLWCTLSHEVWTMPGIYHVVSLADVPTQLKKLKIFPEINIICDKDVMTYVNFDDETGDRFYSIYAYNRIIFSPETPNPDEFSCSSLFKKGTIKGSYRRPGEKSMDKIKIEIKSCGNLYSLNPWSGKKIRVSTQYDCNTGFLSAYFDIQEDELLMLQFQPSQDLEIVTMPQRLLKIDMHFTSLELYEFNANNAEEKSFLRSRFEKCKVIYQNPLLIPIRKLDESLSNFAGRAIYSGYFDMELISKDSNPKSYKVIMYLGNICDTFNLQINGKMTEFPDQVFNKVDISELVVDGRNDFIIIVTTNLYNKIFSSKVDENYPNLKYIPRDYGIWESEDREIFIQLIE